LKKPTVHCLPYIKYKKYKKYKYKNIKSRHENNPNASAGRRSWRRRGWAILIHLFCDFFMTFVFEK
jgi:hypothetical protein